jgi:tripartite ATP-independent transporter DctP family solute receptor
MTLACYVNQDTPEGKGFEYIKEHLEAETDGRFTVELYFSSTLGTELELIEQIRSGTLSLSISAWGGMDRFAKDLFPFVVPYLYPDREAARRTWNGPIGDAVRARLLESGIVHGGIYFRGNRQLTSNKRIAGVQDVKGLKLRLPETSAWIQVWSELGAIPSPIPTAEVFSALQTGVVDAQENPVSSNHDKKLWEVQKYISLTNHIVDYNGFYMSKKWLDTLDEGVRTKVMAIVGDALAYTEKYSDEKENELLQDMVTRGMTVVEVDMAGFREKARPAMERIQKEWQPWIYEQVLKDIKG